MPSEEEELQRRLQEREEQQAREEAALLAEEEALIRKKEEDKAKAAYNEILAANSRIRDRELLQDAVVQGAPNLEVIVSSATTDSTAERIALDVGTRMQNLLNRTPEIYIYREGDRNIAVKKALFNEGTQQYAIIE